ncbi:MAG TPA: hypothetical protein VFU06_04050 [Longimicrobiales bacterium]|nr:hypothetical protein [Longimicrobiales bacterium]
MIARTWHGRVPAHRADEYFRFLERTGLADYRATPGNLGVTVLRTIEGDVAHFRLISFWESYDAIRRFAGEELERAHYYPEDDDFLLEKEERVTHEEVLVVAINDRPVSPRVP